MIPSALPVLLSPSAEAAEAPPGLLLDLAARAAGLAEGARAANTRRAYAADWRHFTAWCAGHGLDPLPAEPGSVGFYLTVEAVRSHRR